MSEDSQKLILKVSEKKAVSLYSINRFPVTLYAEQWLHILDRADELRDFIRENSDQLAKKEPSEKAPRKKNLAQVVPIEYIPGENGEQIVVPR